MNIAVIEEFNGLPMYNPSGMCFVKGFSYNGHNTIATRNIPTESNYDLLVIVRELKASDHEQIYNLKKKNPNLKVIANVYRPVHILKEMIRDNLLTFAFSFSITHDGVKQMVNNLGGEFYSIPHCADSLDFYPMSKYIPIETTPRDFSFIGKLGAHGNRGEDIYLKPLYRKGYTHHSFGFDMAEFKIALSLIPHNNLNFVYNNTKVNLNFHYPIMKQDTAQWIPQINLFTYNNLNQRTFEIAMAGAFQICDNETVSDFFDGAVVYSTPDNWLDTFEKYLREDSLRNNLAEKAYKLSLERHSYSARMKEVEKFLDWKN